MTADNWPSGGHDPELSALQERYLSSIAEYDIPGLLRDDSLGKLAIVSSFGTESAALLHYVTRVIPSIPVVFIDTLKHFDETIEYRNTLADLLGLNIVVVSPQEKDVAVEDPTGDLHSVDVDTCCKIRKVFPLQDALDGYDSWISGRKRFQGGGRSNIPVIERDGRKIKINPLALWSQEDITAYFAKNNLPRHPLEGKGFASVGCWPCTRAVEPGGDARSGRWATTPDKTECGIHLGPDGRIRRSGS